MGDKIFKRGARTNHMKKKSRPVVCVTPQEEGTTKKVKAVSIFPGERSK